MAAIIHFHLWYLTGSHTLHQRMHKTMENSDLDSNAPLLALACSLPRAHMHSRGKAMPSCLCVCVSAKKYWKMLQGCKGVYRRHSLRKTISMIILGRFCTWYKSRQFFISATSYYRFRGSTPFEIARSSYGQQCNSYSHTWKYRRNWSGNVRRGTQGKYSMNTL